MDVRRKVCVAFWHSISANYRLVRKLRVFDYRYYLALADKGEVHPVDPLWGYLRKKGDDYLTEGFVEKGWEQFAEPHPLFDTGFYLNHYFPKGLDENPFAHYLRKGWKEGHHPGPFFEPEVYKKRSDWQSGDPLSHYSHIGAADVISPGLNFDIDWYLDRNPVFSPVKKELIKYYKLCGAKIGKSPLPVFNPDYYLSQLTGEIAKEAAAADPFSHYHTASDEGVRVGKYFDPTCYFRQCEAPSHKSALVDYLTDGVHRGYYTDYRVEQLAVKPTVSVVVPVFNPDLKFLNNCIRSVLFQAYPHWELCLADDCSSNSGVVELLGQWAERDSRIKIKFLEKNGGIAKATNAAVSLATGEYLGFLDNDDELSVDCLYHVVKNIAETGAELVYTDEDLIGDDGSRLSIFRKPDFNPELLLSHNYITHFVVASASLFHGVGGLDSSVDGAQDFDLMLKLSEKTDRISHIPKILYHWRASETSTSINHGQKNYAHKAGKTALFSALERRQIAATVVNSDLNFFYRIVPELNKEPTVAVFLWLPELSIEYVASLRKILLETLYNNVVFVAVSPTESVGSGLCTFATEQGLGLEAEKLQIFQVEENCDKAAALDQAIRATESDYIAFLELPLLKYQSDWLEQLLGSLIPEDIGFACGRILYNGADGPSYNLPDLSETTPFYYYQFLRSHSLHANGMHCSQEIFCGAWEIAMMERKLYLELGGFDWYNYPHLFSMVDLCIRLREAGKRILYNPQAKVDLEKERSENGGEDSSVINEKRMFQETRQQELLASSSFYNLENLSDNGVERKVFLDWLLR